MYKGLAGSSKHCGEPVELNKLNNLKGKYREKKKIGIGERCYLRNQGRKFEGESTSQCVEIKMESEGWW